MVRLHRKVLETVRDRQPKALEIIRTHNFVFDGSGGQWEKLAFTFYTDLCDLSNQARQVLDAEQD